MAERIEPEVGGLTLTSAFHNSREVEQLNPGTFIFKNAWYSLPQHQSRESKISLAKSDRKSCELVRSGF